MNSHVNLCQQVSHSRIENLKANFKEVFMSFDRSKNRYEVFKDFVLCSAYALRNSLQGIHKSFLVQELEDDFIKINAKYKREDQLKIPELFHLMKELMEAYAVPHDVLGEFFMEFELGSSHNGQHFTPSGISDLMAMVHGENIAEKIKTNGFITVSDPACGASSTLLAVVKQVILQGFNPFHHMYVEGVDIDRLVALIVFEQ
ncbi:N6-Mtase domain-containing protein [Acinetobacter baumannii]